MQAEEEKKKKRGIIILILLLVVIIVGLCMYILFSRTPGTAQGETSQPMQMEQTQAQYVKPEEPVDRSQNIVLPGWGGFTIPANTKTITQGFEFHNPEENYWYEDEISVNGTAVEKLVVDSGNKVEIDHYLKLAGIEESAESVTDFDKDCFAVEQNEDGAYTLEAIGGFEGEKTLTVQTAGGEAVTLTAAGSTNCYYMTFGLYLSEGDELLYQSDLVSPGMYIQKMEMTRALEPGVYDAYVVCQPYRSDKTTKTNQGVVRITLTVA